MFDITLVLENNTRFENIINSRFFCDRLVMSEGSKERKGERQGLKFLRGGSTLGLVDLLE